MRSTPLAIIILAGSIATTLAGNFTSVSSGNWNETFIWSPEGTPQTGSEDSIIIGPDNTVIFTGGGVGLPGSGDLGVAGGQSITLNGGILSQTATGSWVRIGHETDGTLNINDGAFFFTDGTGGGDPRLQIGIRNANGFVNIGDGIGAPGSAILNLRDIIDGSQNNVKVSMNLGATEDNFTGGRAGTIVIKSDGVLEGDIRKRAADQSFENPVIRVGQAATVEHAQSSITVDGGQFNARGTVEIGSNPNTPEGGRSNGLIRLTNSGRMDQSGGEFNIGFHGDAEFIVENNAVYSKTHNEEERQDILIGRDASAVATVTVQSGGQFLRGEGENVGDLRIGWNGTGTMTINDGGLVENRSRNWDWIGENAGSHGTLTVNEGGAFIVVGATNFNVGVNTGATGLVTVNGGTLDLQNTSSNAQIRLGQNGTATFQQIAGETKAQAVIMAENDGHAIFDLQGGTVDIRSQFFMGGTSTTSAGTGTATATQSGGTLNIGGAFVVGLASGHTASFEQTGGTINHTGSDISVGESGTGTLIIGKEAVLTNTSGGFFFVGRNEGSSGTLLVDGQLTNDSGNPIRVGNGNPDGVDNTNGTGLLGGTGTITAVNGGVRIGSKGVLTGGTLDTVGTLSIEGPLSFSENGTLFINFADGKADRISLTGEADISGSLLDGSWGAGGITGPDSRYWLLVLNNDETSLFGTFANTSLTGGNPLEFPDADAWITIDGQEFAVNYSANFETNALTGGNDLLLRAVPEPSTAILLGSMLCLTFGRRRRNARQA